MTGERAVAVAHRLVSTLLGSGVSDVVLSPGSRSGPLALAVHAAEGQGLLRLHVRVDEREAGFLALGLAKASGRPVAVLTTSGTAVANLHPALLEALHARVPVLAVTADRPARLRGTGANQTTDQRAIFPRLAYTETVDELPGLLTGGAPAHLNLELDEPLIEPTTWVFDVARAASASPPAVRPVALPIGPRTVVVAGDGAGDGARDLAERAGWPLLADPSSGARSGPNALSAYRLLLGHTGLGEQIERVVSFGHATLSRPVTALLSREGLEVVHVGDQRTFPVTAGPTVRFVAGVDVAGRDDPDWLERWRAADAELLARLPAAAAFEVARAVWSAAAHAAVLYVGSSNPVRDLDLVAPPAPRTVVANRGLAGIDGLLSSAIGAALARPDRRSLAYVGDLTFLHGSNGLLIGPTEPRPDLTIVVASDDGGSIFATLEQGAPAYQDAFERVYATPTGADIAALCAGYRVPHTRVAATELPEALVTATEGIAVLEVPLPRHDRRDLSTACADAARSLR